MGWIKNLWKISKGILPLFPYIFIILTLAFGGTYAYKKAYAFVNTFINDVNSSFVDITGTIESLEAEQSRIIDGINIYVDSTERQLEAFDRSMAERQAILEDRERRNREAEHYLAERFRELGSINQGSEYIIRLADELTYRYYNGDLEISIYDYLEGEQEVEKE